MWLNKEERGNCMNNKKKKIYWELKRLLEIYDMYYKMEREREFQSEIERLENLNAKKKVLVRR